MGWKRSGLEWKRVKIYEQLLLVYLLICTIQTSSAATDPTDGKDSHSFWPLAFCVVSLVND